MTVGLGRGRFTYKKEDILLQEMSSEVSNRENMKFLLCASTKSLVEFDRTLNFRKLSTDL